MTVLCATIEWMEHYFIKTFGCQMNENDSEIMAGTLEGLGLLPTSDYRQADVILVNTCSVRDTAERKAAGFIQLLTHLKSKKPGILIGIVGCMAQRLGDDLLKKYRFVDFVLGPGEETGLGAVISGRCGSRPEPTHTSIIKRKPSVRAWIKVMEGCDNFCSFCIVPYVRGREKSRPVEDVIGEMEALDKSIYKEVMLLGQNVNSYQYGFNDLLKKSAQVKGLLKIRFMTSHPKDMSPEIIETVAQNKKLCKSFHLPLQSGDNEVLKRMNRGYTREDYRRLVAAVRKTIPEASVTSDIIAGFPGETEEQFRNTLDLIEELELDSVITAAYDPRPGTAAQKMDGQVPAEEKGKRLSRLIETVERTALKRNKTLEGKTLEVLVEEKGFGRTDTNKIVRFKASVPRIGELVRVRIERAASWVLNGSLDN